MTHITGGDVLAASLAAVGVREVFTLHGGHLDAFLVACAEADIRLTDTRHEATAGYAAEGFARATGELGVCVSTAGPGFANTLTAMTDAWLDATPVLFISGSPPLREAATNPLQGGFDQAAMAAPVTKWAHRVTNIERIPDLVDKAARIALSGRPGPVYLEVPIDVLFDRMSPEDMVLPSRPALVARPAPAPAAVEAILSLLSAAERPAIIVGGGVRGDAAVAALTALAELAGTPVLASSRGNGAMPAGHPLNLGSARTLAAARAAGAAPADLVIQVGARAGLFLAGRSGAIVSHEAKLAQIDLDGAEIGRIRPVDVAVVADAGEAFAALEAAARGRDWPDRSAWIATLARARSAGPAAFAAAEPRTAPGLIHPFHAARAVAEALSLDTAIAYDGGESSAWFHMVGRSPGPGLYIGNGYLGTLGVGQGFAIGLARARPGKPVCAIMGDGAAGFHLSDFDTMARHGLPIVTCIFNNAAWGMSLHGQDLVYGRQRATVATLRPSAYHVVAQGLGCDGEVIDRVEAIGPAVRRAQASGRPTCLNIMTDREVAHPVTAQMVGRLDDPDAIAIPYYENIPLRRA